MEKSRVNITSLCYNESYGINVYTKDEVLYGVTANLVRCALGEADMEYLLETEEDEVAFSVHASEYLDFKNNCEYITDYCGNIL
jgi:hypothetical protein